MTANEYGILPGVGNRSLGSYILATILVLSQAQWTVMGSGLLKGRGTMGCSLLEVIASTRPSAGETEKLRRPEAEASVTHWSLRPQVLGPEGTIATLYNSCWLCLSGSYDSNSSSVTYELADLM